MSAESLDFLRFFAHKHTKVCIFENAHRFPLFSAVFRPVRMQKEPPETYNSVAPFCVDFGFCLGFCGIKKGGFRPPFRKPLDRVFYDRNVHRKLRSTFLIFG